MRELTQEEMQNVDGGVAPILGLIVSAAGHFTARTFVQSALGRVGYGLAIYGMADYVGQR